MGGRVTGDAGDGGDAKDENDTAVASGEGRCGTAVSIKVNLKVWGR